MPIFTLKHPDMTAKFYKMIKHVCYWAELLFRAFLQHHLCVQQCT